MKSNGLLIVWLSGVYLITLGAGPAWSPEKLQKYVHKKIKLNEAVLRIQSKNIGDEGARFLAQSPMLKKVKKLVLYDTGVGDEGIRALASSAVLHNLETLLLENNLISDQGVQSIADS